MDSDLVFHGLDWVYVPSWNRREMKVRSVSMKALQKELELSECAFKVLGVVSGNEYCANVRSFGILTNLSILRSLEFSERLLEDYCDRILCPVEYFSNAVKIFMV